MLEDARAKTNNEGRSHDSEHLTDSTRNVKYSTHILVNDATGITQLCRYFHESDTDSNFDLIHIVYRRLLGTLWLKQ